jgi:hypothetical protein
MAEDVDAVMQSIPEQWRKRWCGAIEPGGGGCACMGCVQIGNRLIMADRKVTQCDPEYIDESKIAPETYKKFKVSKEEWTAWMARQS